MAEFPAVLNKWTIDRFYTETVRELIDAGKSPSEAAIPAKEAVIKGFGIAEIPAYVQSLGEISEKDAV